MKKLLSIVSRGSPSLDAARSQLGGSGKTGPLAGTALSVEGPRGTVRIGVVVFSSELEVDIWVAEGKIRRVPRKSLRGPVVSPPKELCAVAADAGLFLAVEEGQLVRFEGPGGSIGEGIVREKCRYGAFVLTEDGKLVAASFRRIWPASELPPMREPA